LSQQSDVAVVDALQFSSTWTQLIYTDIDE